MKNILTIIVLFLATTVAWGQSCSTFQGTDPGYVLTAGQLALSGTNSFTGAIGERYKLNLIAGQTYVINGCTGFDGTFSTDLEFSIFNYSTASLYQDDNDDCGSDNDETYTFVAPYTGLYWLLLSENDCDIACLFGCTGTVSVTCTTCPSSAPAVPAIGQNNPVATDLCADAPLVQNLEGYGGSTSSAYTATGNSASLVSNFCGTIENNSFIKFIASATTAEFEFWIPSCSVGTDGVQFQVFSVTGACATGTWTSVSNGCVNPTGGANSWGKFVATGLTAGNTYYLMFDGFAGNVCDYVIKGISGLATCPLDPGTVSQVCNTSGTSYTVQIPFTGGGTKSYTITGGTNTGDNPSSVASGTMIIGPFSNNTGYTINISTADGICDYDFSVPTYSCPDYCAAINPVDNGTTTCGTPFNLSYVEQPVYEAIQTSCGMVNVSSPTPVALGDDDSELDLPIGFTFNFFGTTYTTFNLHSNGIISFDAPGSDVNGNYLGYSAVTIPNGTTLPNNYIAGLYTDLNPTCGGTVTYKTIGTAPNRQLVVTWTNIEPYEGGCNAPDTEEVTFQIVLTEGTNAINTIVSTLPTSFSTSWTDASNATQGVEAGDGAVAFTTPGRNWQVWTGVTPTDLDCTTFQPVPLTVVFNGWYTGGAGGTLVGTGNPQAVTPAATTTYTGSWTVNGRTCTKDVVVTISGGPTITLGTATNVTACGLTDGTIPLTFTNVPNGTYTLSYEKDGTPATASITVASNAATLTGLGAGSYANFSITVSGCTATAAGPRAITAPSAPVTTGATICPGGTGTLSSSTSCPSASTTGSLVVCASIGGTFGASPGLTYNLNFSAIPAGATVTGVSYGASNGSSTDWASECDFNLSSPTITDGVDLDAGDCCGAPGGVGDFAFPAGSSIAFNGAPASGTWIIEWHDDASPYTTNTLAANSNYCVTVTYATTAPGILQWYTAATGGTPVQTGSPFNPVGDAEVIAAGAPYSSLTNSNTPGTYTFYAACSGAPDCRTATNFVINAGPSVSASNDGPLTCTKTSVTLSPSAASGTITYAWPGGLTSVSSAGSYTVTATDSANGCTATSSTTVTANTTPPSVSSSNDGPLTCTKTSVTLSPSAASGTITYAWPGGSTSVSSAGNYTVTATDSANGCTATSSTTVAANTTPPTFTGTASCSGGANTGQISQAGTGGSGSYTYAGSFGPNLANGTYTITITDAVTGCTSTAAVAVSCADVCPTLTAQAPAAIVSSQSTCSSCALSGGVIAAPSTACPAGSSLQYSIDGGTSWSSSVPTYNQTTAVTVMTRCNCNVDNTQSSPTNTVTTVPGVCTPVSVTASNDGPLTCTKTTVALSPSAVAGTVTYAWSGGSASVSSAGTYTVTATDSANGCSATSSTTVSSNTTPPSATAGSNSPVACGGTINLTSSGGGTYAWSGTGGYTSTAQNPSRTGASATMAGPYTVVVTAANGCTAASTATVVVGACTTRTITITDPCSCNNDATVSVNGTPALPVTDGTFNEVIGLNGLVVGDVITVNSVTGLQSAPGTPYTPATAAAAFVVTTPTASLNGVHTDNVGYTISVHISNTVPGSEFEGDLVISNKCAYPNPNFSIGSFVDCNTAMALTTTHSAEGNGTAVYSGTGVSGTNFTPTGLTGAQTITLTYTGITDANGGISPDSGTTPAFPGCQEVIQKPVTVNCPACAASQNMQWGN